MPEKKPRLKPRNYVLGGAGVMRFSQSRMYKKRALYRPSLQKVKATRKKPENKREARMVKKDIGGEKNGGSRVVRVNRMPKFYPTQERPLKKKTKKIAFSQHKRNLRSTISPGTVLILLAGRHKGKRVVFLKQLGSGLLLVTGPYHLNGCPLRRINQIYVIATSAKVDISSVKIPDNLNDEYFRRQKLKKPKHTEGDIFDTEKEKYTVSEERKKDQVDVDKAILEAVRQHPEKKLMFGYLGSMWSLKNHQFPHKMKF